MRRHHRRRPNPYPRFFATASVFDMANHSRHAATRHSVDVKNNCVVLTSEQAWEPGQQVCLPYGDVSLLRSIQLYGAAFNEPESERYRLQLSMAPHAAGYREKAKVRGRVRVWAGAGCTVDRVGGHRWHL